MTKQEWNAIIASKLKEGVSVEDLKHTYAEGIELEPNVLASDIVDYAHTINVDNAWINMAEIHEGSAAEKNTTALQALQQGANGLSIHVASKDDVQELLSGIMTGYLDVRLECTKLSNEELEAKKASVDDKAFPNVRWVHKTEYAQIRIEQNDRIAEIKSCLRSIDPSRNTDVIINVGKQLLFEIASVRAVRSLLEEKKVKVFNILCTYDVEGNNELGDYDLIEKTYKIMSAVLGGANAIMSAYDGTEQARLTLNIHNVLDLESGMKNVLDPLSGAYYIEKLTGEIIKQVKEEA